MKHTSLETYFNLCVNTVAMIANNDWLKSGIERMVVKMVVMLMQDRQPIVPFFVPS
ncbi:MAG: hypothetical protein SFW62_06340 [Alphaproteobacteria bacterium]|nr:hypothetical protein [Alphaproteobacteria bacterium]